ncbi:MAG: type II toxin-antitoxin system VapC family toxin [Actinobacteria bacterium]|jgi:predicted nucleic acid-binding protein|nr:type II toxin-antitoxin system VapC family toxin [Actinomycetota bacterium]
MTEYLLDTTIIIDHLRGDKKVNSYLEKIGQRGDIAGCCCINIAEIYSGMLEKEAEKTDRFINSLYYYEVTREISKVAGKLRQKYQKKGKTLATTDIIIGAAALIYDLILVTKNIKHYPFPELEMKEI